jgi:diaminohydroxyphosphoribosylaminopyrimidine deaminase/5-amino-6-(5-phosphoribosylamino)uracil reductase
MEHAMFMHRCLELASLARRDVGNGALVGAVLVRDGKIIAEGFHAKRGAAHAERDLLEKFSQEIRPDDILYTNLEPCCHHGRTPPCTDIILERGIRHVVWGMIDPDIRVAGEGNAILKKNGVTIEGPVLRAECEWMNKGFTSVRTKKRPWITLKSARMSDGRIANDDGSPLVITSPEQNKWSHEFLRARHDAILVGVQTVINDNPILDARLSDHPNYHPWRIILDPQGRIPHDAKVVSDEYASSTIIIVNPEHQENVDMLRKNGVYIFPVVSENGEFVWEELWRVLLASEGDFQGVTSVLVEGGARTWEIFKTRGLIDMGVRLMSK